MGCLPPTQQNEVSLSSVHCSCYVIRKESAEKSWASPKVYKLSFCRYIVSRPYKSKELLNFHQALLRLLQIKTFCSRLVFPIFRRAVFMDCDEGQFDFFVYLKILKLWLSIKKTSVKNTNLLRHPLKMGIMIFALLSNYMS